MIEVAPPTYISTFAASQHNEGEIKIPYSQYICPDNNLCKIEDCLRTCRLSGRFPAGRCLSHRTLYAISEQREWTGIPSATQLLSGTREEYLKITKEYSINPQSSIFALFGTGCHAFLEQYLENDKMVVEERLKDPTGTYSGAFDCYDGKRNILYDVKTYGSFKTAKAMGLHKRKEPVMGSDGVQLKYKNGRKMFKTYYDIKHKSVFDVSVQLNAYRIMVENQGYTVDTLLVEIFTRDAGTFSAKDRGIETNAQLLKLNKISDRWIQRFMLTKAKRLKEALEHNTLPPACSHRETWGGRKCQDFCAVWQFCDVGRKAHGK